jgi:branched-subunit amino acid aminotransferase/4-amino-4-deoxychorismate lyase
VAWLNGEFMPEREVRIPFRDRSWIYGDGCFDMTRSFGQKLFKVKEHVNWLYRSLKYLLIDPGFGPQKMCALTDELFERNRHLLGPDDDYAAVSAVFFQVCRFDVAAEVDRRIFIAAAFALPMMAGAKTASSGPALAPCRSIRRLILVISLSSQPCPVGG